MTVEEKPGSGDQFPVGMRVLAVDDDLTCLKVLESLLRRCRYHVTTTNQAIIALKMLRENKDKFDLVISDVRMPDMDGFKLLEQVGLEMDLPVIMLSGLSDPKAVMKGITHGACDYLLKPVRLEELRNIWQHVVRKKIDPKDVGNYDHGEECDKLNRVNSGGHGQVASDLSERNAGAGRKRKDQKAEDSDDSEEDGHKSEDSSTQKKARVVWSPDLHRKFVAAVNQLGIDKAMPKRILDLMNVDNLTRENVASHLQKYRLYLRRLANQQANIIAGYGGRESSYLHMGSPDGAHNYHGFAGSSHVPTTFASFQQGGTLGRLNSPPGSGLYNLTSSGMIQLGHLQNTTGNPFHDFGELSNMSFSGASKNNFLQGIPTSLELKSLQQAKAMLESSNPLMSTQATAKAPGSGSSSCFLNSVNNPQILQIEDQPKNPNEFRSQPSASLTSLKADLLEMNAAVSSFVPDNSIYDSWTEASSMTVPPSRNLRDNGGTSLASSVGENQQSVSLTSSFPDLTMARDYRNEGGSLARSMLALPVNVNQSFGISAIGSMTTSEQRFEELRQDQFRRLNLISSCTTNSMLPNHRLTDNTTLNAAFDNEIVGKGPDMFMMNQSIFSAPMYSQNFEMNRSISSQKNHSDVHPTTLQGAYSSNGRNSLEDLMSVVKREHDDTLNDGDIAYDLYSLETCM